MSTYSAAVLADTPFVYYPDASAAPWVDDIGTDDITMVGATENTVGPLAAGDTKAFLFDGVDDSGQVALNLSDTSVVTVELFLWWDAFSNNDDLAMEFTANFNSSDGSFIVDPNSASGSFEVGLGSDINNKLYTRPSAAAWHHYAFVLDRSQAAADEITSYLDGAPWTANSQPTAGNNITPFASSNLNVMCRNAASLFGAGKAAHLAVYKATLPPDRVSTHFAAAQAGLEQTSIWPFNRQGPF